MNSGQSWPLRQVSLLCSNRSFLVGIPQPPLQPGGGAAALAAAALPAVEVRSYQGTDLSSVNDFHEILSRVPQYINERTIASR